MRHTGTEHQLIIFLTTTIALTASQQHNQHRTYYFLTATATVRTKQMRQLLCRTHHPLMMTTQPHLTTRQSSKPDNVNVHRKQHITKEHHPFETHALRIDKHDNPAHRLKHNLSATHASKPDRRQVPRLGVPPRGQ